MYNYNDYNVYKERKKEKKTLVAWTFKLPMILKSFSFYRLIIAGVELMENTYIFSAEPVEGNQILSEKK